MDRRHLLSPTATPLEPLEKDLYQRLKAFKPLFEKQTLIVAVSGGLDSISLLHILATLQTRLGYKLHVVHVHHGVRGKEADYDAHFVERMAKKLKLPFTKVRLKGLTPTVGENQLRQRRYEALFKLRKKLKATFIATAHHQDDLLETRLMRLLQGTGIHGLRAMVILNEDNILRPLLHVSRREIEAYAKARGLDWCTDATNEDTTKLRNWIRRNWLSVLRNEHPEYVPNLFKSLDRLIPHAEKKQAWVPSPRHSSVFDRRRLAETTPDEIYSYLRQFAKGRVTSRHVAEFQKQLKTPRKKTTFRLAGTEWIVDGFNVTPGR